VLNSRQQKREKGEEKWALSIPNDRNAEQNCGKKRGGSETEKGRGESQGENRDGKGKIDLIFETKKKDDERTENKGGGKTYI